MGKRYIGALAMGAAMLLAVNAQQRAPQPAPQPTAQRGQPPPQPAAQPAAAQRGQQPAARPARIGGHPNLNGVWQALNTASWNLEAHSAQGIPGFWQLRAIASTPPGKSVWKGGGTIPYRPEALKQRDENRAKWPQSDPEAKCYMLGIP